MGTSSRTSHPKYKHLSDRLLDTNAEKLKFFEEVPTRSHKSGQSSFAKREVPIFIIGAYLFCFSFTIFSWWYFSFFYHDDSFIGLRYVHNLLLGNGLVWNPSEEVEGYSNFLFLGFISAFGRLGADLEIVSQSIGMAAYLCLVFLIAAFAMREWKRNELGYSQVLLCIMLTSTACPLLIWSLGGLETTLFAFFMLLSVILFLEITDEQKGKCSLAGIAVALASMTRPEGVLLLLVCIGFLAYQSTLGKRKLIHILALVGGFCFLYVPYWVWRFTFYGEIFPNTYYVKGQFEWHKLLTGIRYVAEYCGVPPFLLPLAVFWLIVALIKERRTSDKLLYLTLVVASYLAWIIYVGGDHMLGFRFLAPVIPIGALWLAYSVKACSMLREELNSKFIAVAVAALAILQFWVPQFYQCDKMDPAAFVGAIVGKYICKAWPSGSLVALNTAGSTPYFAPENTYIDMLGLNDRHIARRQIEQRVLPWQLVPGHEKGDGSYVLERNPDYIILGPAEGNYDNTPWFLSDMEIAANPAFHERYVWKSVLLDVSGLRDFPKYRVTKTGHMMFTYYQRRLVEQ
jgi:arabinofuranosyltransferase